MLYYYNFLEKFVFFDKKIRPTRSFIAVYKQIIKILGRFFIAFCFLFSNLTGAASNQFHPNITTTKSDAFTLDSSQLGLLGPFSFGINRDNLLKYSWNAQYTQNINNKFAISGLIEAGENILRINGTLGFSLFKNGLFKITAERLSQVLPFTFDSGSVNQRMAQNAYGARYQYAFDNKFFRDISLGGYYADTPNKSLDSVALISDGASAINDRNIAGGMSKGFDIGTDWLLTNWTILTGHVSYDSLHYKTIYSPNSPDDASGIGGSLGINQLLGDHLKLSAEGNISKLYDSYKVGISWLPPAMTKLGFEVSLVGQRSISHNETPNSNSVGLQFNFHPAAGSKSAKYQLTAPGAVTDVVAWTSTPAVHMDRVLAVVDQRTRILVPTLTGILPTSGPTVGGTTVIITGTNFTGASSVKFGSTAATSFTVTSNTQITAVTPAGIGTVDVTVTTLGGTTAISGSDKFTYSPPPAIKSISPNFGDPTGKANITIIGSGFTDTTIVKFGDTPVTAFNVISDSEIDTISPAGSGTVAVSVTTPSGTSDTKTNSGDNSKVPDLFTYKTVPVITLITPSIGRLAGGTKVTITGNGFIGTKTVNFGFSQAVAFNVIDDSHLSATSPAGLGVVDITVTNATGTSSVSAKDQFQYSSNDLTPVVTHVVKEGKSENDLVTITGVGFTGATQVNFGNNPAPNFNVTDDLHITATPPTGKGKIDVTITTPNGKSAVGTGDEFSYEEKNAAPVIDHISPRAGIEDTPVTITGSGFFYGGVPDVTAVMFSDTEAGCTPPISGDQITCTVPGDLTNHLSAPVKVITGHSGESNSVLFTVDTPAITTIGTSVGPQGTTVAITGTGLISATGVKFENAAASYDLVNDNLINAIAPIESSGKVHVRVTNDVGDSAATTADLFSYIPTVISLSQNTGPTAGGTSVTITGTGFATGATVKFGGVASIGITTVESPTSIICTTPAGVGKVDVVVTNSVEQGGQSGTLTGGFSYIPTVISLSQNTGPTAGGTPVTITGTGFATGAAVTFGGVAASDITVGSPTQGSRIKI